jgi:cytochrome bd-type quinol oxidase subunit 2
MKRGFLFACAVLLAGAIWLALTMSGQLGEWAKSFSARIPPVLVLTAVFAIPILAALCSLHLKIDWKLRIGLFVLLLVCVPLLPIAFEGHPAVVALVAVVFAMEEFGIIPFMNRRWLSRN